MTKLPPLPEPIQPPNYSAAEMGEYARRSALAVRAESFGAIMKLASLPAIGQPLEDGLFAGVTTHQGVHSAVVLLPAKPDEPLTWSAAMEWAASIGGQLPTRPIGALLFAGVCTEFKKEWHWTSEEVVGYASYAWCQNFGNGGQYCTRKSGEERARAVRLIPLEQS